MKRLICAVLALVLVAGFLLMTPPLEVKAATGDEVRSAKKIISVVYDDSTSMHGDRWAYANYATQALIALLNEQDELHMTFMSNPDRSQQINLKDIPGAVEDMRNWNHDGGTPEEALDTANKVLDGISASDPTTQYWLVIMTDGAISMATSLQDKLNSFKGRKMPNDTRLNVVYFAMGESAGTVKEDPSGGLYAPAASDAAAITDSMQQIANLISGRLTATNVKQVDDKTISFSSKLPLYSISVLSQNSTAQVVQAKSQEQTLNINRNIPLQSRDISGTSTVNLVGNAAVINLTDNSGNGKVIQADTYTITFSEKVDVADLVVQYEPAIGIKALITREGIEISDYSQLAVDDKVTIEIFPVIPGTDTVIPTSDLPQNISWGIEYIVDGKMLDSGSGTKLSGVSIQAVQNEIRGIMNIPGFAASMYRITYDVDPHVYKFGVDVDQPNPLTYYRSHIQDGSSEGGSVKFWITDDGARMSKEELKTAKVTLEMVDIACDDSGITGLAKKLGKLQANCRLIKNDDGSFTLEPAAPVPFTAFFMKAGTYQVTVCIDQDTSVTAIGTFNLQPHEDDPDSLWWLLIVLAIIIYLIYIIFIKYKFRGQTVYYGVYRLIGNRGVEDGSQADSKNFTFLSGGLLWPTRACRVKWYGLILEAGPDGSITVLGKSIANAVYSFKQTGVDPKTLGGIVSTMKKTERIVGGETVRSADDLLLTDAAPIYLRSDESDKEIWCLYTQD